MKLSEKLNKARKDKNFTQEYVASQINVSRKTISSWENGRGQPNSEYLKQLNSIYNTKLQFNYTHNNSKNINKYFNIIYFINLILFILCLINLFTGYLSGIAFLQLLLTSFFFICYRNTVYIQLKNKKSVFILLFLFIIIFGIIMSNIDTKYVLNNNLTDLPFYLGAIFHSLILTSSFFIITNYRNKK